MVDDADVCVLIPTLNEAETIGDVVDGFREQGLENVLVVDGRSSDETRDVARDHGARVTVQDGSGKGQAVRQAVEDVDSEYVLLVDGDGTYDPADAEAMLEPLLAGHADHVIGNRFADMGAGAMTALNRFGNGVIDRLFATLYGTRKMDILSGYRAFTTESIRRLSLTAEGFGIETEMAAECARLDVPIAVVPITYTARPDGSSTNLRPFRDGGRILLTMYLRTKTSNPTVYFGAAGGLSLVVGVVIAAYVGVEWVTRSVSHDVLAVVAAFAVIVGIQLFMFGALSDLVVTLHREQLDRIDRIEDD
jgi:dolichol-phosphate mannosyltransferase